MVQSFISSHIISSFPTRKAAIVAEIRNSCRDKATRRAESCIGSTVAVLCLLRCDCLLSPFPQTQWSTDGLIYSVHTAEPMQMWHGLLQLQHKVNITYSKWGWKIYIHLGDSLNWMKQALWCPLSSRCETWDGHSEEWGGEIFQGDKISTVAVRQIIFDTECQFIIHNSSVVQKLTVWFHFKQAYKVVKLRLLPLKCGKSEV